MTYLVERLAELRRHLRHLGDLRPRVPDRHALARDPRFPADLVHDLEPLSGFRNVLIHEYVALDLGRAVEALDRLAPVERFARIVADIEQAATG